MGSENRFQKYGKISSILGKLRPESENSSRDESVRQLNSHLSERLNSPEDDEKASRLNETVESVVSSTVKEVKDLDLEQFSTPALETLLEAEKNGKDRKGVKTHLNSLIDSRRPEKPDAVKGRRKIIENLNLSLDEEVCSELTKDHLKSLESEQLRREDKIDELKELGLEEDRLRKSSTSDLEKLLEHLK